MSLDIPVWLYNSRFLNCFSGWFFFTSFLSNLMENKRAKHCFSFECWFYSISMRWSSLIKTYATGVKKYPIIWIEDQIWQIEDGSFWCLWWLKQKFNYKLNFNRSAVLRGVTKHSWSCNVNKCEGAPGRYYFFLPNFTDFTILTRGHKLLAASQDTLFFPHTHVISRLGDPRIDPSTLLTSSRQYYVMVAWILYSDQNHFLGTRHSLMVLVDGE